MMCICNRCHRKYDAEDSYIEDKNLRKILAILLGDNEYNCFCIDCIYKLDEMIQTTIDKWYEGKTKKERLNENTTIS